MRTNNKTLLDLSKVQHGTFYYVNQYGQVCYQPQNIPKFTVRMQRVSVDEAALYHPLYHGESTYERAKRLNLLDEWTPIIQFQLTANHNIQFTGSKAVKMWELWRSRIYGKNKK